MFNLSKCLTDTSGLTREAAAVWLLLSRMADWETCYSVSAMPEDFAEYCGVSTLAFLNLRGELEAVADIEELPDGQLTLTPRQPSAAPRIRREYADGDGIPQAMTGGGTVVIQPPATVKEVMDAAAMFGNAISEERAQSFLDYYGARGWRDKWGHDFTDWRPLVRLWIRNGRRFDNADNTGNNGGPSRLGDPRNTVADYDEDIRRFGRGGAGADGEK